MRKSLPPFLSVSDAIALMLNLSYTPGDVSPTHMFSYFTEESESKYDHASTPGEKEKYRYQLKTHKNREKMAEALIDLINTEIDKVRRGDESVLEIEDDTFR